MFDFLVWEIIKWITPIFWGFAYFLTNCFIVYAISHKPCSDISKRIFRSDPGQIRSVTDTDTDYLWKIAKQLLHICSIPSSFLSPGVQLDPSKAWCPVLECQAVCSLQPSTEGQPTAVACLTCHAVFCSGCRGPWQDGHTCPERQPMMSPSPSHESRSVRRPTDCSHTVWAVLWKSYCGESRMRVFVRTKLVTAVNKLLKYSWLN